MDDPGQCNVVAEEANPLEVAMLSKQSFILVEVY